MPTVSGPEPKRPKQVSPYAQACLDALSATGLGRNVSLGGAFGLLCYLDYRHTKDVEAWWVRAATGEERKATLAAVEKALGAFGEIERQSFGDVARLRLLRGRKTIFSFDVAVRSAAIEEPVPSPWPGIAVDTIPDLVASKMAALVRCGASRDFRDIYMLCQHGLMDVARCWELWRARQLAAGEDADARPAACAVQSNLERITTARPLGAIADRTERAAAEKVRTWYAKEFVRGILP